jgi:nucleoid-associated protein YgaU
MVERVTFLIEQTNERVGCLLNPESLTLQRVAGVQPRRSISGGLTGTALADDPLLYSGGGRTELRLDLLFDIGLAGSSITTGDVRDLTLPLWNLAENSSQRDRYGQPPLVRFIWGKSWNVLGVVVAVAEHLEDFTPGGTPRRSWLRLQMVRVDEAAATQSRVVQPPPPDVLSLMNPDIPDDNVGTHESLGGGGELSPPASETAGSLPESGAFETAADLIASVLEDPHTKELLNASLLGAEAATDAIAEQISSVVTEEGDSEQTGAIAAAVETVQSTLAALSATEEMETVGAFSQASLALAASSEEIRAGAAAMEPSIGQRILSALSGIDAAAAGVSQVAARVSAQVKKRATQTASAALGQMNSAIDVIGPLLGSVAEGPLSSATHTAMETITSALASIGSGGRGAAESLHGVVQGAIGDLTASLESLWLSGAASSNARISTGIADLALASARFTAATAAISVTRLVSTIVTPVSSALETLRSLVERYQATGDRNALIQASQALATIDAATGVVRSGAEESRLNSISEAVQTSRANLDRLADPVVQAEAVDEIMAALEVIHEVVDQMNRDEEAALDQVMQSITADLDLPGERTHGVARANVTVGQRLDQLAFHYYGSAAYWRLLAAFNEIDNPMHIPAGRLLRIPPLSEAL